MASGTEKPLSEVIDQRRATPSFDGKPIPDADLKKILEAGLENAQRLQPAAVAIRRRPLAGRPSQIALRQLQPGQSRRGLC
jgi:nitroreductase